MNGSLLRLSRIRIYPLKGAAGLDLEESETDAYGLRWDRRWMLVDGKGRFLSQRSHPQLALIRLRASGHEMHSGPERMPGSFAVSAPGMEGSAIRPFEGGEWREVSVHGDRFFARRAPPLVEEWFQDFLKEPCGVVFMPEGGRRERLLPDGTRHRLSLADAYPLHLVTVASLSDLSAWIGQPLDVVRFRPNLVVEGGVAWEEDRWREVEVGEVLLSVVKPCARCSVPAVDPETGARQDEPLRVLGRFRKWEGKIYFGQNAVLRSAGTLRVGDEVRVLSRAEARPPLGMVSPAADGSPVEDSGTAGKS